MYSIIRLIHAFWYNLSSLESRCQLSNYSLTRSGMAASPFRVQLVLSDFDSS